MDLSLRGSQINLATRTDVPSGGTKPGSNHVGSLSLRPRSALASSGRCRKNYLLRQQSHNKRPLSADSKFLIHNIDELQQQHKKPKQQLKTVVDAKKKYASSTNLVKLLMSETKSNNNLWTPTESDLQSEQSSVVGEENSFPIAKKYVNNKNKSHDRIGSKKMDNNILKKSKNNSTKHRNNDEKLSESSSSTPSPLLDICATKENLKLSNINANKGILKQEIKDELKRNTNKSYQTWISENIKAKNLDLPGRVSFSTNDVYEIDYSDYEDLDKSSSDSPKVNPPKPSIEKYNDLYAFSSDYLNNMKNEPSLVAATAVDDIDETFTDLDSTCCIKSRYNSLYDNNLSKIRMETKAREEANKIVEEYKKEIEELKKIHSQNPYTSATAVSSNYFSNNSQAGKDLEMFKGSRKVETPEAASDLLQSNTSSVTGDTEKSDEKTGSETKSEELFSDFKDPTNSFINEPELPPLPTKLNNFWESTNSPRDMPTITTQGISIRNSLKNKINTETFNASSNNNNKKMNEFHTTTTTFNTSNHNNNKKRIKENKPKSAINRAKSAPIQMSMKMKKSKSITSLKEDHNIDEFEIDKVVSWMSIHESDNFSDTASLVGDTKVNNKTAINTDWKTKSNSLGMEDQGNYSTEDGQDTDSPYEEIVSVIKEIDEGKLNKGVGQSLKSDVEFKLNTILSNIESPDSAISDDDKMTSSSKGGSSKVSEILSFLDEAESKCEKTLQNIKQTSSSTLDAAAEEDEFVFEPDATEDIPKVSELLMLTNHQLCRKIVNLSLRVNELNNAIQLSKEHVSNVRAEKMKTVRLEKQNTQKRLNEQKKHYEDIVQRHQTFIEQLLKDKANLCEKVNQTSRRLESQNQAWEHKLKTEIERAKETVMAGEKLRREKWVRDNTKKIKELTVKGLEAEINKMQSQHQQELNEMKKTHQKELMEALDDVKQKFDEKEREIRDSYAKDREGAIERERLAIVERFEKQIQDERKIFEQQKQHLIKEFEEEKTRICKDVQAQKHNYDASREKLKIESMDLLNHVKSEFKEKIKQRESKHQNDIKKLEEQFETDFAVWKREYETTMKLRECERENYIRQQNRIERDRQIDSIVAKVDAEALKNQQEFEMKISRLKEKYEREIKELEKLESETREKYIEQKTKLAESEANGTNLQATVKQMETQLNHFKKMCDDFMKEKETVRHEIKKEIQIELKTVQHDRDAEIQRIYSRVQKAIEKKDVTLEALQKENAKLKERCIKLDAIVKQQRKDYIKK